MGGSMSKLKRTITQMSYALFGKLQIVGYSAYVKLTSSSETEMIRTGSTHLSNRNGIKAGLKDQG